MYEAVIDIAMRTKKTYESSTEVLCFGGSEVCDLTLLGSMTREVQRISIDSFSPQAAQEYSIRELADAVKNVRYTFCSEPGLPKYPPGTSHGPFCTPKRLGPQVSNLVSDCKGLDLSSFRRSTRRTGRAAGAGQGEGAGKDK